MASRLLKTARHARLLPTPAQLAAWLTVLVPPLVVLWPWLVVRDTYGFHDWDVITSHRELVRSSVVDYGEFPGWNPYACGGFPAWGYVEGATNVVSPFLPVYLLADIRLAIRIEVLGMALLGSAGAYLLAGRFTESFAARALVPALFAVNGRFGLQAASGHAWHLAYALLPWVWLFFEKARHERRAGPNVALVGLTFAMLVYAGGIYPLPHAVLLLAVWAMLLAATDRSLVPITRLAQGGALGIALAAPKLLPMLATFGRAPRLVDSNEVLSLASLWTLLTSRAQGFFDRPAPVRPYGWHEWGMYVSFPGVLLMLGAFVLVRGKHEALLKVLGALFVVLGLGAFHAWAPWSLLHAHAPFFRSQHVPSRFLYPAVLVLALVAAVGIGRLVMRWRSRFAWLDAAVGLVVLGLALDVAMVAQKPMTQSMWMRAPAQLPRAEVFRFAKAPPFQYEKRDWAGPMYLAMRGNVGVLDCYGTPPFTERGAVASTKNRGEASISGGGGIATISAWSPNGATVSVEGAHPGARLVYNMNYDQGWGATVEPSGAPAVRVATSADAHRISVELPAGDSSVRLHYSPPNLWLGLALAAMGLGVSAWLCLRAWRAARLGDDPAQDEAT